MPLANQPFESAMPMLIEAEILATLEEPAAVYPLTQRLDPSSKSTYALQVYCEDATAGKVKFDIKTGKWCKS